MISKDKQYRTRDGREVRIYATDCGNGEPVHGAVKEHGEWVCDAWNLNGSYILNKATDYDLIEVKPRIKREYWVNVYPETRYGQKRWSGMMYKSKEDANMGGVKEDANMGGVVGRIACVKIVIDCEEGEGL